MVAANSRFDDLTTASSNVNITSTFKADSDAMIWVDRNSNPEACARYDQAFFDNRVLHIKKMGHMILLALSIEKDITVYRLCDRPTFLFPVVYCSQVNIYQHDFVDDHKSRIRYASSCEETADMQDAAASANSKRMFGCLADRLGCAPELLAAFAEACNDNLFSLFLTLALKEIFVIAGDTPGLPKLEEQRDACEGTSCLFL
jgi:hypothetical protein